MTAIMFFQEQAGYATPPGRLICAWKLAKAEQIGEALGWEVSWEEDDQPDTSWCEKCESGSHEHPLFGAVLKNRRGQVLSSLWGIDFSENIPSNPYKRVVEAELMLEAIAG